MRKNSPRKWLHACLDLLPVFLIPVFMIYSHRHTIEDYEVVTGGVSYSQKYETNEVVYNNGVIDTSSLVNGNIYYVDYNFTPFVGSFNIYNSTASKFYVNDFELTLSYVVIFGKSSSTPTTYYVQRSSGNRYYLNTNSSFTIVFEDKSLLTDDFFEYFNISAYYGQEYNPYVQDTSSIVTYNDTDITSQFIYSMYNTITKYFNTDEVFNMGQMHQWITDNIFGGSMPLGMTIVYHIIVYEFVMDLLFLLYGLFMWFIDMVQHIMDKPFKSIK